MKNIAMIALTIITPYVAAFAESSDVTFDEQSQDLFSQPLKIVPLYELSDQELTEAMQGLHPEMAVEFSAKTILPIHFFLTGDLIHLLENEGSCLSVEIQQTFYIRCVQEELMFSTNLMEWKPFLEFATGVASAGLNIQEGQPSLFIGSEANLRS
jgi:hypothetical protein